MRLVKRDIYVIFLLHISGGTKIEPSRPDLYPNATYLKHIERGLNLSGFPSTKLAFVVFPLCFCTLIGADI